MISLLRRVWTAPVVATLAFAVLGLAWALSTPPGAAPDEPSHYVRMVGLARGHLVGERVDPGTPAPGNLPSVEAVERMNREAGIYEVPRLLTPPNPCNSFQSDRPYACPWSPVEAPTGLHISYHARYLPGAYVVPAALSRAGDTMWQTLFAGRVGFVLQATALFGVVAAAVAARCRRLGRLPTASAALLAVGVTPLVVFMAGTLAPNGTEVMAVAAVAASAMALATGWSQRWVWCLAGCVVVASWSRDLGAITALGALVAAAGADPSLVAELGRHRRDARAPFVVASLGVVSALVWQMTNKVSILRLPQSWGELTTGLAEVGDAVLGAVGLVGWLDVPVNRMVQIGWVLAAAVAAGAVLTRVASRVQCVVAAVAALVVLAGVELSIGLRAAGFGLQARFLLPLVAVGVVVLVMAPQRDAPWSPAVVRVALVGAGAGHLAVLVRAAHRHANGLGRPLDLAGSVWAPPLGWAVSVALMVAGSVLVAVMPLRTSQRASGPLSGSVS